MVLSSSQRLFEKGVRLMSAAALIVGVGILPMQAMAEQAATGHPAPAAQAVAPEAAPVEVAPEVAPVEAAPVETGDANVGKALFTGETRLQNGGPACMSCHSAGVGELGGGILGPNLTMVYADESKNPFLSTGWVNGGGSPVMGPIFAAKNVTDEEMSHLRAFFKSASERGVVGSSTGTFTGIGIIGAVGILILFSIIWGRRYSKRNQNTAHDALWRNYGGKGGRA